MRCRSPSRNTSIIRIAFGSGGGGGVSPETASGHTAPWSIHVLITLICSGLSGPSGGICNPTLSPISRRYSRLAISISRPNHGDGPAPHGVAAAVQPKAVHLQRRAVAAIAVGSQNRLHVAAEIDFRWRLGRRFSR